MDNNPKPIVPLVDIPGARSKFITPPPSEKDNGPIRPMQFTVRNKGFEEKIYIILYKINDIDEDLPESRTFSVCIGRTMAYSDIKNKLIEGLDIDVHRSYIMTETKQIEATTGDEKYYMIPYSECMSVYAFCVSVANFYGEDDFDIEEYASGDVPEDDRMNRTKHVMSQEQMEYRQMLEDSIQRDKFIAGMRAIYGPESGKEVVEV